MTDAPTSGLQTNDYTILKSVRAVCPRCFAEDPHFDPEYPTDFADGHLVARNGAVYLRRFCRRGHGEVWSLYEEDAELWYYLQQWRVPTKRINPDTTTMYPVPTGYEYGLGPAHLQHSCIFLLDITTQCNLSCPACFTSSSPATAHFLALDDVVHAVDVALEREGGSLDVVMISGGEPTVHPQIAAIVETLAAKPITRILLNTNGTRIANDDGFVSLLARYRGRVEMYLQYDGQDLAVHEALRGVDLREIKSRAIERLSSARVFTTLVATISTVNEGSIGEILETAFATPYVGGVMFQPIFASGRSPAIDPLRRVTTTGVLRRIEAQTGGSVAATDLIALPCSHPDCCSIGYFIKDRSGTFTSLARIVGLEDLKKSLTIFGNSIAFTEGLGEIRNALLGVMSESMTLSRPELVQHLGRICTTCDLGGFGQLLALAFKPGATADFVAQRVKRVTIKHFMDADMLIAERLEQCCVHVAGAGNDPGTDAVLRRAPLSKSTRTGGRVDGRPLGVTLMDDADRRLERGRDLEGYAFTFCKAAFLALILRRYTLLGTSLAAAALYLAAARDGVRDWRCFIKPPWVVVFFVAVSLYELRSLRSR